MQTKAKVISVEKTMDGTIITLMGNKAPKIDEIVTVKWGKVRSIKLNNLYWLWLNWLVDFGGMKEQGYQFAEEIHEALKSNLLVVSGKTKAGFEGYYVKSTTELTTDEFKDYMEKGEALIEKFCGISSHMFWVEVAKNSSNK